MTNKPSLWMLAARTFAVLAVVAYLIFALTLADHMKSDLVPPDKAASYVDAVIEADRTPYNIIPNTSSTHSTRPGLPTPSNIVETKMAFLSLHSFSWSQDALSLKRISSSRSDWAA